MGGNSKGDTLALRDSYVYHVLRFLSNGQARSAPELLYLLERGRYLKRPKTIEQMEEILDGIRELGLFPDDSDHAEFSDLDSMNSGDHGGGGGGSSSGGPGEPPAFGSEGGEGLSEVLGHAVLFCLPDESQEELIDAAFGVGSLAKGVE